MRRNATGRRNAAHAMAFALFALLASAPAGHGRAESIDAGASAADGLAEDAPFLSDEAPDPFEPVNRPVFAGNMAVDRIFVDPLARVYGAIAPAPLKSAVRGVFSNLNRPVVFVNELLQLAPRRAAQTLGRFVLNSTLGVGGLLDPAAELGWHAHEADFGQTLGRIGIGPGFYVVLPILGPSTARDTVGTFVDMFMRIDAWILPFASQLILGGSMGISMAEKHRDGLAELRRSSLDFYAAVRSAYLQSREKLVREARARPIFVAE